MLTNNRRARAPSSKSGLFSSHSTQLIDPIVQEICDYLQQFRTELRADLSEEIKNRLVKKQYDLLMNNRTMIRGRSHHQQYPTLSALLTIAMGFTQLTGVNAQAYDNSEAAPAVVVRRNGMSYNVKHDGYSRNNGCNHLRQKANNLACQSGYVDLFLPNNPYGLRYTKNDHEGLNYEGRNYLEYLFMGTISEANRTGRECNSIQPVTLRVMKGCMYDKFSEVIIASYPAWWNYPGYSHNASTQLSASHTSNGFTAELHLSHTPQNPDIQKIFAEYVTACANSVPNSTYTVSTIINNPSSNSMLTNTTNLLKQTFADTASTNHGQVALATAGACALILALIGFMCFRSNKRRPQQTIQFV